MRGIARDFRVSRRGFLGQLAGAGCLGLLGGVAPAFAGRSSNQGREADALVGEEMAHQHIPGLSLAIVDNGSIVKQDGYGTADRASNKVVLPDTIFRIGSNAAKKLHWSAHWLGRRRGFRPPKQPASITQSTFPPSESTLRATIQKARLAESS